MKQERNERPAGEHGRSSLSSVPSRARALVPLAVVLFALVALALGGGSNRTDVASLIYLRPALVVVLMVLALIVESARLVPLRWPLALFGGAVLLALLQLVPLPPTVWMGLPGHGMAAGAARAAGMPQPWRPISLTPDLTLQSLLWFLAPACALLGWAAVPAGQQKMLFLAILGLGLVSALVGAVQVSSGSAYIYQLTYEGNAVGFLANRNHQGALLAAMFPLLRVATLFPARSAQVATGRRIAAAFAAVLLVPIILLTASRAGLLLSGVGLVMAVLVAPIRGEQGAARGPRYVAWALAGIAAMVVLAAMLFGRALALDRLFALNATDDLRISNTPLVLHIIGIFFPVGSGFGSFDPIFRVFEPDATLSNITYNHAHNDYFEVALTGGIAGVVLMTAGLGWWLYAGWRVFFRRSARSDLNQAIGRALWSLMLIVMLASTVDYPLRAPLMGFVFALAAAWLAEASAAAGGKGRPALQANQRSYR